MAKKTNCTKNGIDYYRIRRKVGKKQNKEGLWVDDFKEFYGDCKSDAERKFKEYKARRSAGLSGEIQYFGLMADTYIYEVFINDRKTALTSKELYINAWKNNIIKSDIAGQPLDEIGSLELQTLYNKLNCSPGTLKAIHGLMRSFYSYLEREGYCKDVTNNLVLPEKTSKKEKPDKSAERIIVWSESEKKKIIECSVGHRLRFLIILLLFTGGRISELLAVRDDTIDELHKTLTIKDQVVRKPVINKNKITHAIELGPLKSDSSERDLPLIDFVLKELEAHKKWQREEMMEKGYRTAFLFTTNTGNLYDRRNINRALNRLYEKSGMPKKSVKTYRSTFATDLCKAGEPIQVASKLLGHSSIEMTAKYYTNIDIDDKRASVEKLDIFNK